MAKPIDHSDDPDMPEYPANQKFVDAATSGDESSRIGRVNNNSASYDESRAVEEYGTTPDFAAAKAAREAGVQVNRYPGKCFKLLKVNRIWSRGNSSTFPRFRKRSVVLVQANSG